MFDYPKPGRRGALPNQREAFDPNEPSFERALEAIANLARAAERRRKGLSIAELEPTQTVLEEFDHVHRGLGRKSSAEVVGRSILIGSSVGMLEDLLFSTYLPTKDAATLAKIAKLPPPPGPSLFGDVPHPPIVDRILSEVSSYNGDPQVTTIFLGRKKSPLQELHSRLHVAKLTVDRSVLTLRNSIPGIDSEATIAIRTAGAPVPEGGLAFFVRHHALYDLFAERNRRLPSRVPYRKDPLFLRYDPVGHTLELFVGSSELRIEAMNDLPDGRALAALAADAPRARLATNVLREVISRCGALGRASCTITQSDDFVAGVNDRGFIGVLDQPQQGQLVIPPKLVTKADRVLGRIGEGATVRNDETHYYVEKGVLTVAFSGVPMRIPPVEKVRSKVGSKGVTVRVQRKELLNAALLSRAIVSSPAAVTSRQQARFELSLDIGPASTLTQRVTGTGLQSNDFCVVTHDVSHSQPLESLPRTITTTVNFQDWLLFLLSGESSEFQFSIIEGGHGILLEEVCDIGTVVTGLPTMTAVLPLNTVPHDQIAAVREDARCHTSAVSDQSAS